MNYAKSVKMEEGPLLIITTRIKEYYIMQKEQECQNRPAVKTKQHFCIFLIAADCSSSFSAAILPI